jgi:hypothetical protein
MNDIGVPIRHNADDWRQCVACDYICGDVRVWDEAPLACPGCGRKGIWLDAVDWSTCGSRPATDPLSTSEGGMSERFP